MDGDKKREISEKRIAQLKDIRRRADNGELDDSLLLLHEINNKLHRIYLELQNKNIRK